MYFPFLSSHNQRTEKKDTLYITILVTYMKKEIFRKKKDE